MLYINYALFYDLWVVIFVPVFGHGTMVPLATTICVMKSLEFAKQRPHFGIVYPPILSLHCMFKGVD